MKLMISAMSSNPHTKFTIDMANISADKEIKINKTKEDASLNFDPSNPEGMYNLDLEERFDQIILQYLLDTAEKAVERSGGTFEVKQCFAGVTFNGKSKWDPPLMKNNQGLFDLGEEPSGLLKFQFTNNPPGLKEFEKMLKKANEEGDSKKIEKLKQEAAKPIETLDEESLSRAVVSDAGAVNFFEILLEQYT